MMSPRRLQIINVLLFLFVAHTVYFYIQNEIVVTYAGANGEAPRMEFRNPLLIIFTGRTPYENNTYGEHPVSDRVFRLIELTELVLIVAATSRYVTSRERKTGALLFALAFEFWTGICALVYKVFYYGWLRVHPDIPVTLVNFGWDLLYLTLPRFIALYFMIRTLQLMKPAQLTDVNQNLMPLQWMRGFHALADRLIMVVFAFNMFGWFYYSSRTKGWVATGAQENSLRDWWMLSMLGAFLIGFLLMEGLFSLSPAKALTATQVVSRSSGQAPSWVGIIGRSLARFIPLDEFSFIFGRGWHDSLSGTTLQYTATETWLSRTSRLTRSFFFLYLFIAIWAFVTTMLQAYSWKSDFEHAAVLPQVLLIVVFPVAAALFICYVASLSNLAQNLQSGEPTHSSIHFLSALLCWVPVLNYIIPGKILYEAAYSITYHDTVLAEKFNSRTRIFCRLYGLAYTLIVLGTWSFVGGDSRFDSLFGGGLMSVGAIIWCVATIVYSGQFKSVQITKSVPETSQVTENLILL